MIPSDTILELLARVERAMRPLSASSDDPDHERVRALYADLASETELAGDPLEQARIAVLYDILQPYLAAAEDECTHDTEAIVDDVKAAIGALVLTLCHLEDHDHSAARASLTSARDLLHDAHDFLSAFHGTVAQA
jgi:hypothetical protein